MSLLCGRSCNLNELSAGQPLSINDREGSSLASTEQIGTCDIIPHETQFWRVLGFCKIPRLSVRRRRWLKQSGERFASVVLRKRIP